MEDINNIFKLSIESTKLALLEFDKELLTEFSPRLDYISITVPSDNYKKLSGQLSAYAGIVFREEETELYSLTQPLVCTQEHSLSKILLKPAKGKEVQVDHINFVVEPLSSLHSYFNKQKYHPGNIIDYPNGNKQFLIELNKNKMAFSKDSFAQDLEINSLRNRLNIEIESKIRLMADFQNYKKRTEKILRESGDMASKALLNQVIEVIDDCFRALQDSDHEGIKLLIEKLKTILKEQGLIEIKIRIGDKFNPEVMEAISSIPPSGGQNSNEVLFIEQRGYRYSSNNNIYRPAKVIVTK